jgi:hypothetical protein
MAHNIVRRRGRDLNREWRIGAMHALYREDGTWYHQLREFPGALIDAKGYILFANEQDYRHCSFLQIGKEIGVPGGISKIPGYRRMLSTVGEPLTTKPLAPLRLGIKDDQDLAVLSKGRTVQMQRLHNAMTNGLLRIVGARRVVYEGNRQEAMFDVLIQDYQTQKRDLLIEVKSSTNVADVRLAIGQLLDYRRFVNRPDATDLAVLLPEEPNAHVRELLKTCDILLLWFEDKETLSRIRGALEGTL